MCTFNAALMRFNLSIEQQFACFENLFISKLLLQDLIWQALYALNSNITAATKQFLYLNTIFITANTYQSDITKFNAKYILEHNFPDDVFNEEDLEDFFTYWCQKAYGRKFEQEVYELNNKFWMKIYYKHYFNNAITIGLINKIELENKTFSETWVMGAARFDLYKRLQFLHHSIHIKNNTPGFIRVLTGERELWAEIDGIGNTEKEKVIDGKKYLTNLAVENNLASNQENIFIKYSKQDLIPKGRQLGRTYLNLSNNHKLTEIDLCYSLYQQTFNKKLMPEQIIATQASNYHRPTTETTTEDAIEFLIQELKHKKYPNPLHIQVQSNQPFILRQTIQAQRIVNAALQKRGITHEIILYGVGPMNTDNLAIVHSEFGALIAEKYLIHIQGKQRKRSIDDIMLQTRKIIKNYPSIPLK